MAISQATLDFLMTNYVTDSREWFNDHRAEYQALVVEPMAELVTRLAPGMLKIDSQFITEPRVNRTISRIHRDMRIPQNRSRSRYRPNCWITFARDKKLAGSHPAFFFEVEPSGFSYGMGYYNTPTESMRIMRDMILAGKPETRRALTAYARQRALTVTGETFKRPRYPDQPENLRTFLERRSLTLLRESDDFDLLFSPDLADTLLADFKKIAPVYALLCAVEARRAHNAQEI